MFVVYSDLGAYGSDAETKGVEVAVRGPHVSRYIIFSGLHLISSSLSL